MGEYELWSTTVTTSDEVRLIELPLRTDGRGSLTFAQEGDQFPFTCRRTFWLHGMSEGATRGGHAHRSQHQLVVLVAGVCKCVAETWGKKSTFRLDSPSKALYVPPLVWLDLSDFSAGAVCLVLTSDVYDETDYIRDHSEFRRSVS